MVCCMPRIRVTLSMTEAQRGSSSQTGTPGSLLDDGFSSLRMPEGAPGFMSKVSIWLGPPHWWSRMTDLARAFFGAAVKSDGAARPRAPAAPTRNRSRRLTAAKSRQAEERFMRGAHRLPVSEHLPKNLRDSLAVGRLELTDAEEYLALIDGEYL